MLYSTSALVLAKREIKDREFTYTLLTSWYGKVGGFAREVKNKWGVDIGNLVEVLFDTKNGVNRIRTMSIVMSIQTEHLEYTTTHDFLLLIESIRKHTPEGSGEWIFEDISFLLTRLSLISIENYKNELCHGLFLLKLRLLGHFQNIDSLTESQHPLIGKLARLAEVNNLEGLFRIQGIPESAYSETHTLFLRYFFS